jgi:hypothetical protein
MGNRQGKQNFNTLQITMKNQPLTALLQKQGFALLLQCRAELKPLLSNEV